MSEFIIDTSTNFTKKRVPKILPLYNEHGKSLSVSIPEYDVAKLPNSNMSELISDMKKTMTEYNGIGLSANQCGVLQRVFVMGTNDFYIACINPKIITVSENTVKDREGCLTFPGLYLTMYRPEWVDVEFYDENGKLVQTRFEGVTARCFMHELDHMNGKKFTEYFDVNSVSLKMARKKQQKLLRKHNRK